MDQVGGEDGSGRRRVWIGQDVRIDSIGGADGADRRRGVAATLGAAEGHGLLEQHQRKRRQVHDVAGLRSQREGALECRERGQGMMSPGWSQRGQC
eukprot:3666463-Rhodomonas_salina.2